MMGKMTDISTEKKEAMPSAVIPPVLAIFAEKNGLTDLLNQVQGVFESAREKNVNLFYFLRRTLGSLSYVVGGSQKKEYKSVMSKPELGKHWEKKAQDWQNSEGKALQESKEEKDSGGGDVEIVSSVLKTILDFSNRVSSGQPGGAWVSESDAAALLKTIRGIIERGVGKIDTKVQPGYRYKPGSGTGVPGQKWDKSRSFGEPSKIGRTSSVQAFISEILEAAIQRSAPLFPVIPPVDFTMRELLNIRTQATDEKSANIKSSLKEERAPTKESLEHFARFSLYEIAGDIGLAGENRSFTKQNKKDKIAISKQIGIEAACSNLLFDVGLVEEAELFEYSQSVAEGIVGRVIEVGRIMSTCAKFNTATKIASAVGKLAKKGKKEDYEFLRQFGYFDWKLQRKIGARLSEMVERLFSLDDLAGSAFKLLKLIEIRDLQSTQHSRRKQLKRAKEIAKEKAKAGKEGREWRPTKTEPRDVQAAKRLEKRGVDFGLEDFDPEENIPGARAGGDIKDLTPEEQEKLKQGKLHEAKKETKEAQNKKSEEKEDQNKKFKSMILVFKSWLSARSIASRLLLEFGTQTIPGVPEGEESVGVLEDFYMDSLLYPVTGNQKMSEFAGEGKGLYKDAITDQIAKDWFRRLSSIYVAGLSAGHVSTVDKLGRKETIPAFAEAKKSPEDEKMVVHAITQRNIEEIVLALETEAYKRTMSNQVPEMFRSLAKTTSEQVLDGLTKIRSRFVATIKLGEKLKTGATDKDVASFMNSVSVLVKSINKDETGSALYSILKAARGLRSIGQVSERELLRLTKKSFATSPEGAEDAAEIFGDLRNKRQIASFVKSIGEELIALTVSPNATKSYLAIQSLALTTGSMYKELVDAGLLSGGSSPTGEVSSEQVSKILGVVETFAGLVAESLGMTTIADPPKKLMSMLSAINQRLENFVVRTGESGVKSKDNEESGQRMFLQRIYDAASSAIHNQLGEGTGLDEQDSKALKQLLDALRNKVNGGWAEQVLAKGQTSTPARRRGMYAFYAKQLLREFDALAKKQVGDRAPEASREMEPQRNFLEFIENDIVEFWGKSAEDEEAGPGALKTAKKRGKYKTKEERARDNINKALRPDKSQTFTAKEERAKYNKKAKGLGRDAIRRDLIEAMTRIATNPNSRKQLVDMVSRELMSVLNYSESAEGGFGKYDYESTVNFAGKTMSLWDFAEAVINKVHKEVMGTSADKA